MRLRLAARSRRITNIGVVESEVFRHTDTTLPEQRRHFVTAQCLLRFQNFFVDCAGILGIEGNVAPLQRFPKNDGTAHALSEIDRKAGVLQRRLGDLAQNIGLSKFLGANYNSLRRGHHAEGENRQ